MLSFSYSTEAQRLTFQCKNTNKDDSLSPQPYIISLSLGKLYIPFIGQAKCSNSYSYIQYKGEIPFNSYSS